MTFSDKINNILKYNKLNLSSVYQVEKHLKLGQGVISKKLTAGKDPTQKIERTIIEGLNINPDWWERGEGEIFKEDSRTELLDHPLVKGYVKQIKHYEELIEFQRQEIERLKKLTGE